MKNIGGWMDGMIYKNQHNQIEIISRLTQFSNPTSCFVIKLAIASRMVAASFTPIFAEAKNATCGLKQQLCGCTTGAREEISEMKNCV